MHHIFLKSVKKIDDRRIIKQGTENIRKQNKSYTNHWIYGTLVSSPDVPARNTKPLRQPTLPVHRMLIHINNTFTAALLPVRMRCWCGVVGREPSPEC
ncbi:hypothetical protein RRG08_020852 [Elysia crispata]|uniref:Uncharacterized protein n=1 Tax=Elysia crispata TaxID=231223 RepID=A0AAE0XV76_9GAST|nr:hypothetical protein RRG08_020852 [Elysia crispata]